MALKKKKSRMRPPHEKGPLAKFLIGFLVVALSLGVLGGFWFLSRLGPTEVDDAAITTVQSVPEAVQAMEEESRALETEFEEILAIRDAKPEDLELLRRAVELQEAYLEGISGFDAAASARRDAMELRYQELSAANLAEKSRALETEAESLEAEEAFEAAREKLREAFELQRTINESYPRSSAANAGRATRLQRKARYLTAEPLMQQSLRLEAEAETLMAEQKWEAAETTLEQAIELQDRLNREYRGTNQASVSRLEQLKIVRATIRSGRSKLEIDTVSRRADQRSMEGANLEAADLYQEAARLQRQLNENFPESPYASSERVFEFQRKSQTAQSFELGRKIEREHERLRQLLAERRAHEAAEVIASMRRDIRQMEEAFPRSSLNDQELQLKIRYLNLVQSDLGFIQDRVYEAMLPIPDVPDWRMLRTEVPQALYSLIMGTNPSRNRGDTLPVDSVSWTEAQTFCERLGWIMGKPVRLPTENEFRQALGRLRYVVLEDHVWSSADSGGEARAVASKAPFSSGFHDLLGNVSEWLESVNRFEREDAMHIGGNAQDRLEVIFTVPVRESPRGERNRMTGFRFVLAK